MNKIALVGEAWGEQEEIQRAPFVGPSGYHLTLMLEEAGIRRADCLLTNVFNLRPKPSNDVENLCGTKAEGIPDFPPLRAGKYVKSTYAGELTRLYGELTLAAPNVVVALGATAAWALCKSSGINKIRGAVTQSYFRVAVPQSGITRPLKVLPTFHPAYVLRDWSTRPVTIFDLKKALRESAYPDVRRPERTVYIEPTLGDLEWYYREHVSGATSLSIDIETAGNQITCVGFAPSPRHALVVPFVDYRKPGFSYWASLEEEMCAWDFVRRCCHHPAKKIFQNGLYDIHFLWRGYGIKVVNCEDDTMLLHHALQPESEKGLAFLGSVYTDEASWKLMRQRGKETIKRDD